MRNGYVVLDKPQQILDAYAKIKELGAKNVAIDTEFNTYTPEYAVEMARGTGRKARAWTHTHAETVGMSVSVGPKFTFYAPLCGLGMFGTARKFIKMCLRDGMTLWAWNWKAEWKALGIVPTIGDAYYDAMVLAWFLEEGVPFYEAGKLRYKYGLKECAAHLLGEEMQEFEELTMGKVLVSGVTEEENMRLYSEEIANIHAEFAPKPPTKKALNEARKKYNARARACVYRKKMAGDIPVEEIAPYACDDARVTWRLASLLKKKAKEQGLWETFEKYEVPITRITYNMEQRGIRVNVPFFEQKKKELSRRVDELEQLWLEKAGCDIRSAKQCADALYNQLKCWPKSAASYTAKGSLAVNKKALAIALDACPEGSLGRELALIKKEHSKLYKLVTAYMSEFIFQGKFNISERVHARTSQIGTNTGRFAMKNPNLQSTPKEIIREGIVAENGHVFVCADWCVAPDTLLLTEDLRWVRADSVCEGDYLVGFPEKFEGYGQRFERAVVEGTKRVYKRTLRIHTTQGYIDISDNHLLVTSGGGRAKRWVRGDEIKVGMRLNYFAKPWEYDSSREAGWYAGLLDGEGYYSGGLGWGQNPGPVAERAKAFQDSKGWSFRESHQKAGARPGYRCIKYHAIGALQGLDIVGSVRPTRLLPKATKRLYARRLHGRLTPVVHVTAVEELGVTELCAIQTSTKTFIANGFLSHNCSLEIVVMGHFSKDAAITEIVLSGKSQHDVTAEGVGVERSVAKTLNFGLNYGGGATTIARTLNVPLEKMRLRSGEEVMVAPQYIREWVKKYNETYAGVVRWRAQVAAECAEKGYVTTLMGRRRKLPGIYSSDRGEKAGAERQAYNTPIQGTAAEIAKASMVALERILAERFPDARMVLQVHDEILVECRADEAEAIKEIMKDVMANTIKLDLPLKAEVNIGKTWMEAK